MVLWNFHCHLVSPINFSLLNNWVLQLKGLVNLFLRFTLTDFNIQEFILLSLAVNQEVIELKKKKRRRRKEKGCAIPADAHIHK